ncbi:MAG TPA: hypothetical protein VF777_00345 [Phycisphaerales bacterium]
MALLAFAAGTWVLVDYWPDAGFIWWSSQHDRNAHYLQGLTLAMSVRGLDWYSFFAALERMHVWGTAHPVILGPIQWIAGPDHRLAVVPSLVMWCGSIPLAFALARRAVPEFGSVAGWVAALLVASSPAHRAFAVDCMLESGGAFLTLATLGAFIRFSEAHTPRSARVLVVVCLLLFFWKYNYWVLVSLAMGAAEMWTRRSEAVATLRRVWSDRRALLVSLARSPLLIAAAVVLAVGLVVLFRAPVTLTIGGWSVTFTRPHGIVHAGWVLLCLQALMWWRTRGRAWLATWNAADRIVALGIAVPIGIWFLIPKRLGSFLWFLSPLNSDQAPAAALDRVQTYAAFIASDYFPQPWMAPAALLLSLIGLIGLLGMPHHRRGAGLVFLFLAIAAILTADHPMVKSRFVHSWIAALYLTSGLGVATLLAWMHMYLRAHARASAAIVCAAAAIVFAPAFTSRGRAQESGVRPTMNSTLDVTDPLVAALPVGRVVQIVSNEAECWTLQWACLEKLRNPLLVRLDIRGYRRTERDPAAIAPWLASTDAEVIAIVDVPPGSPFYSGYGNILLEPVRAALATDSRFSVTSDRVLPGGERITVWQR